MLAKVDRSDWSSSEEDCIVSCDWRLECLSGTNLQSRVRIEAGICIDVFYSSSKMSLTFTIKRHTTLRCGSKCMIAVQIRRDSMAKVVWV